ncbi:hypothetical protein E6C67_14355 [Azospirillum sp. TSA2s]|uniref:hypothetical protein n=1 Tax=Azospirillum sp. TSA2s TaxID=709810 RepID=UPI0010AA4C27|nr:hypothetical protein [Azospirillum sp. TSA2s]QCG95008.1 hypothetical protein E6C67_14355 [Azospirillum sp. TSA2s]
MAIGAFLLLSGCALANAEAVGKARTRAELAQFSNDQICGRYVSVTPLIAVERQARNLGDCSQGHRWCVQLGYRPGNEDYLTCRQTAAAMIAIDNAEQAAASAALTRQGLMMMQPPPPPPRLQTTCNFMGQMMVCN